jgi:thiamine-monophosphate kinase
VSDIAAMGGGPRHALITIAVARDVKMAWLRGIYAGLRAAARRFGMSIVGGETSRGLVLMLSISMTGTVPSKRWLSRSEGKAGDILLVTGRLGGSIKGRHLKFEPRLEQGRWLSENAQPHAIMDISDGLAKDLPRLALASGTHYEINVAAVPCNRGCTFDQAWGDGEDYELLLAVNPRIVKSLLPKWREAFPKLPLTVIGRLVPPGQGCPPYAVNRGWDHFALSADA